jgi:hypothetical protein
MMNLADRDRSSHFEMPVLFPVCVKDLHSKDNRRVPDYIAQQRNDNSFFSSEHSLHIGTPAMSGTVEETTCRPIMKDHGWYWNSVHQKATNNHRNTCTYVVNQDSVDSIVSSTNTTDCQFHCTMCEKSYGHKRGLQDHMVRAHADKNDPVVMARNQSRKDARVKNSAKKRKDPAYVQARKDAQCKARLVKKIKKKSPNWTGVYVM